MLVTENGELGKVAMRDCQRRGCTCSSNITRDVKHTFLFLIKALVEYMIRMKPQRVVTQGPKSAFRNVIHHHSPPKITLYQTIELGHTIKVL